jgi:hypothetical protein
MPRQLSKKNMGSSISNNVDIRKGKSGSSDSVVVDKQNPKAEGAAEASSTFSPSFLAANMSSLCDEERLLEESKNVVAGSSVRKDHRQSLHKASAKNDDGSDSTLDNDDDDDWQDNVILDPTAVPNNNHMMVNRERDKYCYCSNSGVTTTPFQRLSRSRYLDMLARAHAAELAKRGGPLKHSVGSLEELQNKLDSLQVGENILRGTSLDEMHQMAMMTTLTATDDDGSNMSSNFCRCNILHSSYTEFGMGTARASSQVDHDDERLYMVQLFRQHDTWKNSFVPNDVSNATQQQLVQEQQQEGGMIPVLGNEAAAAPTAQQEQPQQVVANEGDTMETSCCVHLCMQE